MYHQAIRQMTDVETEVKKWGNSLGVIIPAEAARAEGLRAGSRVLVRVFRVREPLAGSFGSLRGAGIDAQRLKDRLRREHGR
jgi:hypothetical protein